VQSTVTELPFFASKVHAHLVIFVAAVVSHQISSMHSAHATVFLVYMAILVFL
jgi:hypothetical protein